MLSEPLGRVLGLGLPTKDKSETLIANIVQNVYTGYDPKEEKVTPPSFSSEPKTAKFRVRTSEKQPNDGRFHFFSSKL